MWDRIGILHLGGIVLALEDYSKVSSKLECSLSNQTIDPTAHGDTMLALRGAMTEKIAVRSRT